MKISGIPETDNPFTMMGLFTIIIEDITRSEERIDLLQMNQAILCNYIRKLLKVLDRATREIDNI